MIRLSFRWTIIALLLLPGFVRSESTFPKLPETFDLQAIDAYVAGQVQEKGFVGLSLAIMRDGKIILAKGYGNRSLEPLKAVEENSSFAVGSVTKQFTCACIFLLADEGKLSVKDSMAKYFPDLTRAKDITILDLMNHVSGYPDYYPLDFVDRRMMKPIPFEQMARDYAGVKLDFEPGSKFSYSNTGYILLGKIVEKVSGESFASFLGKRILEPLKMEQSRFGSGKDLPSLCTGYTSFALGKPEPAVPEAEGWIDAAGGLLASPSDLLKWDLALIDGKVLKAESYKLMTSPRTLTDGEISDYGCGLVKSKQRGETILRHTGGVSGFLAVNTILPRTRSGIVVLANTDHLSPRSIHNDILNLLLMDIEKKDSPTIPKIKGPDAKVIATEFLRQMQSGKIDRDKLGEEFSVYLTHDRVKSGGERLKALGEPEKVVVDSLAERGGMEVASVRFIFKTATLRGGLYRTPDGKIQQLLFYKE